MKLAVLRGGRSPARAVSLKSGAQVEDALQRARPEVVGVALDATTWDTTRDRGFAFCIHALPGRRGRYGSARGAR